MAQVILANVDQKPDKLSGDAGYYGEENVSWLINEAKIVPHIPPDKRHNCEKYVTPRET